MGNAVKKYLPQVELRKKNDTNDEENTRKNKKNKNGDTNPEVRKSSKTESEAKQNKAYRHKLRARNSVSQYAGQSVCLFYL